MTTGTREVRGQVPKRPLFASAAYAHCRCRFVARGTLHSDIIAVRCCTSIYFYTHVPYLYWIIARNTHYCVHVMAAHRQRDNDVCTYARTGTARNLHESFRSVNVHKLSRTYARRLSHSPNPRLAIARAPSFRHPIRVPTEDTEKPYTRREPTHHDGSQNTCTVRVINVRVGTACGSI